MAETKKNQQASIDCSDVKFGDEISCQLYSAIAEEKAEEIHGYSCNGEGERKFNKTTQVRRFYDEIAMWHERVTRRPIAEREIFFQEVSPLIQMICAKAAYARGRGLIEINFYSLLATMIQQVKSPKTLHQAKLFFEAFIGFTKALENKK